MRYPFYQSDLHKAMGKAQGYYELNHFPGCNQLVVSNHSCVFPENRGKGMGQELSEEKISVAKELGFDYMIATVVGSNERQLKIMKNNGWTQLDSFFNRESGNQVFIFGRRLSE